MGDCRCDSPLTSGDWVGADDDECKGQKARRRETGHVLHVSSGAAHEPSRLADIDEAPHYR